MSPTATQSTQSTQSTDATAVDWLDVLRDLDAARSRAFAGLHARELSAVYAPDSPALKRDRALLGQLVAAGSRVHGLRLDVRSISIDESGNGRAVLSVLDVLRPYRLVAGDGHVTSRPGRGPAQWRVTLRRSGGTWQVYDVARR